MALDAADKTWIQGELIAIKNALRETINSKLWGDTESNQTNLYAKLAMAGYVLVKYDDWATGEPIYWTNFAHKTAMTVGSPLHEMVKFFLAVAGVSINAVVMDRDVIDAIPTVDP